MENKITKVEIREYVLSTAEYEGGFEYGSLSAENEISGTLVFDSLDRIDFINRIEDHFEVRLNANEEEKITTFEDLIDAVWQKKQ